MEYYAKSPKKDLALEEKEKLQRQIEQLIKHLDTELTGEEKKALYKAQKKLFEETQDTPKTVREHLEDTVACAEQLFQQYGSYFSEKEKTLILEACRYHDLGKLNLLFQKLVNPEIKMGSSTGEKQIPHGFLSAISIDKQKFLNEHPDVTEKEFYILITAIYYHHAREDNYEAPQIRKYCESYYNDVLREYLKDANWKPKLMNRSHLLFRNKSTDEKRLIAEEEWNKYLLVKGLLNKFDWAVSAGYEHAEYDCDLTEKYLKKKIEGQWGEKLRPAQQYMKEHINDNLIIVAPTGSGKTEAALLWINGEKGFYTLPLKVSSNAIYERIKKQYCYEEVSLLHSDSMTKYLEENAGKDETDGYEKYEKAKLLSGPLTICTVDQLFKFVYKALGTEIFPATLKYSKIVLDEIQAYSPRVVACILFGLKTITEMGGHFAIITATFPPVLKLFMERYGLVEGRQYQMKDFTREATGLRHMIEIRDHEFDIREIAEAGREKKVLVICNTVSRAQEIYGEVMLLEENVHLLHSRYKREDRQLLEDYIMKFSKDEKERGIWITTQIVEASLDIDFDILYTEMCPADSLLQRMGRCNRKERYFPKTPNVIIYNNENGVGTIYDKDLYARSVKYLTRYINEVFEEKRKAEYIEQVYDADEIQNTSYYKEIDQYLKHFSVISPLEYSKTEADDQFRKIDSITVVPDSVYDEKREVFEACCDLLMTPHVGKEVKAILKSKMNSLTMNLSLFYGKYPEGVDRGPTGGMDIHRANLIYEFDPEKMSGKGLILKQKRDENCFVF